MYNHVFPLFYAGNIQYYSLLKQNAEVLFEVNEFFEKQTFRNRCVIATANGTLPLTIPVERKGKTTLNDVKISYVEKWQLEHWRAITSAYRKSPYFEYYEHSFRPLYTEQKIEKLVDFNLKLHEIMIDKLGLTLQYQLSSTFVEETDVKQDFRNEFSKNTFQKFSNKPYLQVFMEKHGFTKNLSIFDLLFNCGPESRAYL